MRFGGESGVRIVRIRIYGIIGFSGFRRLVFHPVIPAKAGIQTVSDKIATRNQV